MNRYQRCLGGAAVLLLSAGACVGAFRPRAVGLPHQERHLQYRWNGERVDRYFDYARGIWIDL